MYEQADAAIAAMVDALLSEAAVEAGARAIHKTEHLLVGEWEHPYNVVVGHKVLRDRFEGNVIDEDDRDGYRYTARQCTTAALEAIGAVEGE